MATTTAHPRPTTSATDRWVTIHTLWVEVMIAFGVAIAVLPWVREDLFFWIATGETTPPGGASGEALDYMSFVGSLLGAVTIGMCVGLWWIARIPLRRGEPWAWTATVTTIAAWFAVDSTMSVLTGFPRNVGLNVLAVATAAPALFALRPRHT
jgi:hypothetical protein